MSEMQVVNAHRSLSHTKELETELKNDYLTFRNGSDVVQVSSDSSPIGTTPGCDEDDDESVEAYDDIMTMPPLPPIEE